MAANEVSQPVSGDGHAVASLDGIGEGYGFRNASDSDDAIYVVVGAKDGYVGRDGRTPETSPRRPGFAGPPGAGPPLPRESSE